ncbi:unnamed protein product [Lymnaea stagnalis]|uniref:Uncharacterized protein n=1 Tax=Lymnaea stagnalis TaxID=6523 RepID=A0AAV2IN76_LYMST
MVWLPLMYVVSSTDDSPQRLADPDYVILENTGAINYRLTSFTTTFCSFDLTYYPLDSQTCEIPIIVYGCDVNVSTNATRMERSPLSKEPLDRVQGEWTLTNVTLSGNFSAADVSYFKVIVRIKRSELYYILCVLLPMVMTSLLTLMVFWIPPGSGEKISYLVTIYMSSTLYLSIVGDTFPRNMNQGEHLHRMTLFLIFIIMEGVVAIIATVLVMRRYHEEVATDAAHQMCQANPRHRVEKSGDIPESGSTDNEKQLAKNITDAGEQNGILSGVSESIVYRAPISSRSVTFKQIYGMKLSAALLDRIFFFIFLAVCAPFYALVFII